MTADREGIFDAGGLHEEGAYREYATDESASGADRRREKTERGALITPWSRHLDARQDPAGGRLGLEQRSERLCGRSGRSAPARRRCGPEVAAGARRSARRAPPRMGTE